MKSFAAYSMTTDWRKKPANAKAIANVREDVNQKIAKAANAGERWISFRWPVQASEGVLTAVRESLHEDKYVTEDKSPTHIHIHW